MNQIPESVLISVATGIFVGGSVWGLAWWLSGQFSGIRNLVYEQINKTADAIVSKLEYHEKHDDARFDDIKRDIWEVKIRQAGGLRRVEKLEKGNSDNQED